jgi:DNA-binding NarL/FixJ family response regulator
VLAVDDHEVVLDGLEAMLRRHQDRVAIVARATNAADALALVETAAPDVVLLDIRLRADSGLDLCRAVLSRSPSTKVVVFTAYDDEQYLFQALRAGAAGYLLKRVTAADLVRHLEQVRDGEMVVDPQLAARVALSAARLHAGEFWPGAHLGLSQRESEVLGLMVRGLSNRAIAAELVVGEETVKTHVGAVYRKLGARDRTEAVAIALREGLFR